MAHPRLSKLELQIMEILWNRGECSVREIQEAFPEAKRPAYTTVQTTVYRLERKGAVRILKRISNANIFEAVISQAEVQGSIMDEMLKLFGGKAKPIMSHLIKTGSLTLDDVHEAEQTLREVDKKRKEPRK